MGTPRWGWLRISQLLGEARQCWLLGEGRGGITQGFPQELWMLAKRKSEVYQRSLSKNSTRRLSLSFISSSTFKSFSLLFRSRYFSRERSDDFFNILANSFVSLDKSILKNSFIFVAV